MLIDFNWNNFLGGFALVYLVSDKRGRNFALKRQLLRDDQRQLDACKTETQIVVILKF